MIETSQNHQADSDHRLIELRDVSKIYQDGSVHALRSISLEVCDGEFVSVMGPSGCGKSTLLNMIGALDRPTSGEVIFGGRTLSATTDLDRLRAKHIGFVFQSYYLLPNLTALENVQLPMFGSDQPVSKRVAEAERLLAMVGLEQRKKHLPNQLSIGQRQRVAIARALACGPSLILADEPTGSLDSQSGRDVMEILGRLNEDSRTTLIVVTHDEGVAARGKRTVKMMDGQIREDRTTQ